MRRFLNFLLGFFITISLLSLFSSWALCAILCLFGTILYALFFPLNRQLEPYPVLIGSLSALTVLDTGHAGRETLIGLVIYGLAILLRDAARFTSEYNRFIVGLIVTVGSYPLIMLPWHSYFTYFSQVAFSALLVGIVTFTIQQSRRPTDYELV